VRSRFPTLALELLAEAQVQGLEPSVIAYNAAIRACMKGAQHQRVLELVVEMDARGLQPDRMTAEAAWEAGIVEPAHRSEKNLDVRVKAQRLLMAVLGI
jgi:pentatricopeptide repeat protein